MTGAVVGRSLLSGAAVGYVLGLVGGGGSIMAVPLLLYFVGYRDRPHTAIGTTALAVAVNALLAAVPHLWRGHVDARRGVPFALAGVVGAAVGARLGLWLDGKRLLLLFAVLMAAVGVGMWRRAATGSEARARAEAGAAAEGSPSPIRWSRVLATGAAVGAASGFFGIGGGFLIVPGLMASTAMPIATAVGTSLLAVAAFGATTAVQYALAGHVDAAIAAAFVAGGVGGGWLGAVSGGRLDGRVLMRVFALVVVAVAAYMALNATGVL
ncbi:MAG: sulfite exporter TauE/SafE family protein [Firmicutes bacterium]|nr:sulfite exporter TauE/SafE family protein [Bacillota bacterium]